MKTTYEDSLFYIINSCSKYFNMLFEQFFKKLNMGISATEHLALMVISDNKDCSQRDLARIILKDRANTGKLALSLEKKGLIKIEPKKEYPNKGLKKFLWGGKSAIMGETPELEAYNFDVNKYDYIIFGTPVWASSFTPPIRTFINENKEKIKGKKLAVFICFMGGEADKAIDKLKQYLEINQFEAELILIDPRNKKSDENDKKIEKFCEKLNK